MASSMTNMIGARHVSQTTVPLKQEEPEIEKLEEADKEISSVEETVAVLQQLDSLVSPTADEKVEDIKKRNPPKKKKKVSIEEASKAEIVEQVAEKVISKKKEKQEKKR